MSGRAVRSKRRYGRLARSFLSRPVGELGVSRSASMGCCETRVSVPCLYIEHQFGKFSPRIDVPRRFGGFPVRDISNSSSINVRLESMGRCGCPVFDVRIYTNTSSYIGTKKQRGRVPPGRSGRASLPFIARWPRPRICPASVGGTRAGLVRPSPPRPRPRPIVRGRVRGPPGRLRWRTGGKFHPW